jgi:RNA polymerase sigma-70 factor (ECF subfamily)
VIGEVTGGPVRRRRRECPIVTRTPLQWTNPAAPREGTRLQFVAFDAPYLERLQRGDAPTEKHFAQYFGDLIRIKLRSRLNSKDAIEDVRQETFVRVLTLVRAEGGIRQPERLGALVNSVCNHVLLEHYRSQRKTDTSLDDEPERAFVDERVNVSGVYEVDETQRVVRKILGDLPERDRRLLQSVLLEERDKDEVCAELGLSRDYLRVLVHRAKQSFKSFYVKQLGPSDFGGHDP